MTEPTKPIKRQWTLMFYFASDNPLAPGIVSQLKALKNAGFHPEVNVITQFDPFTPGTPTHIFDVNLIEKIRGGVRDPGQPSIGFIGHRINNPFIRNLMEDKLWLHQRGRMKGTQQGREIRDLIRESLAQQNPLFDYNPQLPPNGKKSTATRDKSETNGLHSDEPGPRESLEAYLEFCCRAYPAHHYMLFILGHGLVVGNDVFLFDEHADQEKSLSLIELQDVLSTFKTHIKDDQFELLSFHSCSMSSAEVAFQLQDTANYMLASQSPAFIGSWPYRQILIRIFNDVDDLEAVDKEDTKKELIKEMITKIAHYCFHNSADFILAGYSFDIALCSLKSIKQIEEPIQGLAEQLREGLKDEMVKNFILLAHLRSQSYWQESHTDLYDYCFCLSDIIDQYDKTLKDVTPPLSNGRDSSNKDKLPNSQLKLKSSISPSVVATAATNTTHELLKGITRACQSIRDVLEPSHNGDNRPVILSRAAGPEYQFAHGLSVFFPWTRPLADSQILKQYEHYRFNSTSWLKFLEDYFAKTMRETRKEEEARVAADRPGVANALHDEPSPADELSEDIANLVFSESGQLSGSGSIDRLDSNNSGKPNPRDATGDDSNFSSIKNFPRDTRLRSLRKQEASKTPLPIRMSILEDETSN